MVLSPPMADKLARFRRNRRGYYSLWLLLWLFIISLLAEGIANDKPLLVKHNDAWFVPVLFSYAETDFGGSFATEADYRDPFFQDLIADGKGWMLWPLIPFRYNTVDYDLNQPTPSPPDARHWLGTDDRGRDVLARALYGFRLSILFGLSLTLVCSMIGIIAGAVQGYFGGRIDLFGQRLLEIWSGLPVLFLLIILSSLVTPTFWWLLGMMALFGWMSLVGVVRAEFLKVRNFEYVTAARALGVSDARIMFRHILPNAMVATLTLMPFVLNGSIITLTSLDFLGFGLPDNYPSLGELIAQGKANIQAPWLGITAFLVLSVLLSLLIFIGEAVRDAFDPRKVTPS